MESADLNAVLIDELPPVLRGSMLRLFGSLCRLGASREIPAEAVEREAARVCNDASRGGFRFTAADYRAARERRERCLDYVLTDAAINALPAAAAAVGALDGDCKTVFVAEEVIERALALAAGGEGFEQRLSAMLPAAAVEDLQALCTALGTPPVTILADALREYLAAVAGAAEGKS
jgi:hypothetical protein